MSVASLFTPSAIGAIDASSDRPSRFNSRPLLIIGTIGTAPNGLSSGASRNSHRGCPTDVAVRAGRWQAAMFPTVMIVANVATVGVLWFGGHRVEDGHMEVGALTAYISYLMQIVMSVMMAMFMLMMVPRAAVCADRITEVYEQPVDVFPHPGTGVPLVVPRR